jgi:hypothetical protein
MKIVQHDPDQLPDEEEGMKNKVPLYEHYENQEGVNSESGLQTMENITEISVSPKRGVPVVISQKTNQGTGIGQ